MQKIIYIFGLVIVLAINAVNAQADLVFEKPTFKYTKAETLVDGSVLITNPHAFVTISGTSVKVMFSEYSTFSSNTCEAMKKGYTVYEETTKAPKGQLLGFPDTTQKESEVDDTKIEVGIITGAETATKGSQAISMVVCRKPNAKGTRSFQHSGVTVNNAKKQVTILKPRFDLGERQLRLAFYGSTSSSADDGMCALYGYGSFVDLEIKKVTSGAKTTYASYLDDDGKFKFIATSSSSHGGDDNEIEVIKTLTCEFAKPKPPKSDD